MSEPKSTISNQVNRTAIARARNKSYLDIENQRERLINELVNRYSDGSLSASEVTKRANRVTDAARRYKTEIRREQEREIAERERSQREKASKVIEL